MLDHHHRVGAARHGPAGGDGRRRPGLDRQRRRGAAGDHLRVEREDHRRSVPRRGGVGGADREAVHARPVEGRHVDRRDEVFGEHPAQRLGERHALAADGLGREGFAPSPRRVLARQDGQELLLAEGLARGGPG